MLASFCLQKGDNACHAEHHSDMLPRRPCANKLTGRISSPSSKWVAPGLDEKWPEQP